MAALAVLSAAAETGALGALGACPTCFSADQRTLDAYLATAVGLSLLPLTLAALATWWLWGRARR